MVYRKTPLLAYSRNNIGNQVQEYGNKTERGKENRLVCYKSVAGDRMHNQSTPVQHYQTVYSDYAVMYFPIDCIGRASYVKRNHDEADRSAYHRY